MFTNAHTTGWEAAVTQELRGELTVVDQVDDLRDEVADTLDILLQRQHDRVKLSAAHRTLATLIRATEDSHRSRPPSGSEAGTRRPQQVAKKSPAPVSPRTTQQPCKI